MSTPTVDLVETMIDAATDALRNSGVIQHGRSVESVRVAVLVALDAAGFLGLVELIERGGVPMTHLTYSTPTPGTDTGRVEVTAELWAEAAGVLTTVSTVLLLTFLVVVLAAHATGSPVLAVVAVVLASWALLALVATHVADTEGRSVLCRLLRRLHARGGRR